MSGKTVARAFPEFRPATAAQTTKGGHPHGGPPLFNRISDSAALLEAIDLVTGAAIVLADIADGGLQAVEILDAPGGIPRILAELHEPGLEISHVFPNLGTG